MLGLGLSIAAARPPGFVPTQLSGCTLWLRGDLGVTLNGATVSAWGDQSGNASHFTQGTAAAQPTYEAAGGPLSTPDLLFDGSNDFLAGPLAFALVTANAWTAFAVFRATSIATNAADSAAYNNTGLLADVAGDWGLLLRSTPYVQAYGWDGNSDVASVTIATGTWTMVDARHDTGSLVARTHDQAEVSAAHGDTLTPGVTNLGRGYTTNFYNGRVAEVIVYSRALTSSERTQVRSYLGGRYGLVMS
jgi:hypothetical protein